MNSLVVFMVGAGIASHLVYFNRGEHHMYGTRYLQILLASLIIAVTVAVQFNHESIGHALLNVGSLALFYLAGLYSSLLVYRVWWSPLCAFPGPWGARISTFWFSMQLANRDAFRKVVQLHEEYGDFVRIGSNDLSILHPHAVNTIHGLGTKCRKSDFYDSTLPMVSMHTLRHHALHDQRRRMWSNAFSDRALRGYEDRIRVYQDKLMARLASCAGQRVNVSKIFNLYSFDVMGDLAFGSSFGMIESDEDHWAIKLLNKGLEASGYWFPTWFFRLATAIPGLMNDWWKFIGYCSQMLDQRIKVRCGREQEAFEELDIDREIDQGDHSRHHVHAAGSLQRCKAPQNRYGYAEREFSVDYCRWKVGHTLSRILLIQTSSRTDD